MDKKYYILDNIIVVKSATADQPADFTGGVVDIVTKDFPSRAEYSFSAGLGYNSSMHFKDNYLSYDGSPTDALGFDNGQRDLAIPQNIETPLPVVDGNRSAALTRLLEPNLKALENQSGADLLIKIVLNSTKMLLADKYLENKIKTNLFLS